MLGGHAVAVCILLDCEESSLGKYRHVALGFAARPKPWLPLPIGALWIEQRASDYGYWIQFSAVNSETVAQAHMEHWGIPSFLADIDVSVKRSKVKATVSEKGEEVVRLAVNRPGPGMPGRFPLRYYARSGGEILRTEMSIDAVGREKSFLTSSHLDLCRHVRTEDLRSASIDTRNPKTVHWYDSFRTWMEEPSARFKVK